MPLLLRLLVVLALPAALLGAPLQLPPGSSPEVVIPEAGEQPLPAAPPTPVRKPPTSPFQAPKPAPPAPGLVRFHDLSNGVSVVVEPARTVATVAVQLWLQTGFVQEGPAERGSLLIAAELLRLRCERALLAGPPAHEAAAERVTVVPSSDAFMVGVEGPSHAFEGILTALAQAVRQIQVRPDEFRQAQALAIERLRHERTNGDQILEAALATLAFRVHPYRHAPITAAAPLAVRRLDQVEAFLRREVVPARTSLVVVGRVDQTEAARAIIQELGTWSGNPKSERPKIVEPKLLEPRLGTIFTPDGIRRLGIGFVAPPYRSEDAPAVAVLAQLMDPASRSSVARGLARNLPDGVSLEADYVPARDPSLFRLTITGDRFDQEQVVRKVLAALRSLRSQGLREEDVQLAKQLLKSRAMARTQGYADQARALGLTKTLASPETPRPVLERVLALDSSAVHTALVRYLTPQAFVAVMSEPRPLQPTAEVAALAAPEVQVLSTQLRLVRARDGIRGGNSAALRLRLAGIEAAPGVIAALHRSWRKALSSSPGGGPWSIQAMPPGLDRDALEFRLTAPEEDLPAALGSLFAFLRGAALEESESTQRFSDSRDRAFDVVLSQLLAKGPYATPRYASGTAPVAAQSRLRAQLLRPERAVLALSAGADLEALIPTLEAALPIDDLAAPPSDASESEAPAAPRTTSVRIPGGDALVVLATRVAGPGDEGYDGARLLARILGGGPGSRLGRRLREVPGLGFQAEARYLPLEGGPGVLVAWIGCGAANLELSELILREETTRLTVEAVGADELMAAREGLRQAELIELQSSQAVASRAAAAVQRGLTATSARPPMVDALSLLEQARSSFHVARVEGFAGPLASASIDR